MLNAFFEANATNEDSEFTTDASRAQFAEEMLTDLKFLFADTDNDNPKVRFACQSQIYAPIGG